jgi:hypothetical protein
MSDHRSKRVFLGRATLLTLALAAVTGVPAALLWHPEIGLGIALGALVGLLNIALLARALTAVLSDPQRHRPARPGARALPGLLLVKWPLVLLALAGILWYMPARPEGLAAGVILSLVAAAIAGRPRASDSET